MLIGSSAVRDRCGRRNRSTTLSAQTKSWKKRWSTSGRIRSGEDWLEDLRSIDGCGSRRCEQVCVARAFLPAAFCFSFLLDLEPDRASTRGQECPRHTFNQSPTKLQKGKGQSCFHDWPLFMPATTYSPTHLARAVQSALRGLTSVFGMGTGGSPAVRSPTT